MLVALLNRAIAYFEEQRLVFCDKGVSLLAPAVQKFCESLLVCRRQLFSHCRGEITSHFIGKLSHQVNSTALGNRSCFSILRHNIASFNLRINDLGGCLLKSSIDALHHAAG